MSPVRHSANKTRGWGFALLFLRCLFLLILGGTAARISNDMSANRAYADWQIVTTFVLIMFVGTLALVLDIAFPRKNINTISRSSSA